VTQYDGRGAWILHRKAPRHSSNFSAFGLGRPRVVPAAARIALHWATLVLFALLYVLRVSNAQAQEVLHAQAVAVHPLVSAQLQVSQLSAVVQPTPLRIAHPPAALPAVAAQATAPIELMAHALWRSDGCGVEPCRVAAPANPTPAELIQRIGSLEFLSATVIHAHKEFQVTGDSTPLLQQITPSLRIAPTFGGSNGYGLQAVGAF